MCGQSWAGIEVHCEGLRPAVSSMFVGPNGACCAREGEHSVPVPPCTSAHGPQQRPGDRPQLTLSPGPRVSRFLPGHTPCLLSPG